MSDTTSWWLGLSEADFTDKLPEEQARMRREDLPKRVQAYFDEQLYWEEVLLAAMKQPEDPEYDG